jgi:ectoine hydroxylase-related dioxygenase (phytanoyl-CoA dioxygenase family)
VNEPLPPERVSLWMPLHDVDLARGCLQFIPGSHRGGVVPHHATGKSRTNGPGVLEADLWGLAHIEVVTFPLVAGEATLHTMRTLRGAGPNTSPHGARDRFRRGRAAGGVGTLGRRFGDEDVRLRP